MSGAVQPASSMRCLISGTAAADEIGESAGELPDILSRLADRTHRAAARSIDRFAALLEPAVILLLATAIGFVVIGAVLPILKLQEVIG